jgi:hypothetical protein
MLKRVAPVWFRYGDKEDGRKKKRSEIPPKRRVPAASGGPLQPIPRRTDP